MRTDDFSTRDYPLTVLLPVALECIRNSETMEIESDSVPTLSNRNHLASDVGGNFHNTIFGLETLCPIWNGEFGGIIHINTCSIDNMISLLSLHQITIQKANEMAANPQNPDAIKIFS